MQAFLLISSSNQEDKNIVTLLQHVLSEASTVYPQLSAIRAYALPCSIPQLQDWSYWLATEVIDQWRYQPTTKPSLDTVIAKLGLAPIDNGEMSPLLATLNSGIAGTSLSAELAAQITSLRHQYAQVKLSPTEVQAWLDLKMATLSEWFAPPANSASLPLETPTCLMQIEANADSQRAKIGLHLQEVLLTSRQSGLHYTLDFLKVLGEKLTSIYTDYEAQRQSYLRRETSAWRAFYNLSAQLQQRTFSPKRQQENFEAALQGLLKAYTFKLESELYTQACQLVGGLRQAIHLQAVAIVQANAFLVRLKNKFIQQSVSEPMFAPLLKHHLAQQVDLSKLRWEIEGQVGCPITQWGGLSQTQEAVVRQRLLAWLNPLCLEVYAQCYANLMNFEESSATPQPIKVATAQLENDPRILPDHSVEHQATTFSQDDFLQATHNWPQNPEWINDKREEDRDSINP
ncbi:MAG: hypothetical protein HC851_02240 [Acaryochloris sp. RU_4_1]|nr:hypothetical protein [Acaryochloris sp. RU_4_1]NJR56414.1 hypothetical protein [Acaryochloris sp. CRU_2_0]